MSLDPRVIVALDYRSRSDAESMLEQLDPSMCRVKIGKGLFTRCGPSFVEAVIKQGFDVFLDLKFHDIPQTVADACLAAAEMGVWMLNVHVSGGRDMLRAARQAIDTLPEVDRPLLIGVTVLTSLSDDDLTDIGFRSGTDEMVQHLASMAKEENLDGVVCSAQEAQQLRHSMGSSFCLVTPGIRTTEDDSHDQKRILTPAKAIAAGADFLVIGRSITRSQDPLNTLRTIHKSL